MQSASQQSAGLGFLERALHRAVDADLSRGNRVRLLRDGPEVFAAWLADIAAARRFVLFENYIFNNDRIGNRIADALAERARAGVTVCLLYDWFGCIGTSRGLWRRLQQAGVQVRAFNPPRFASPFSAFQRDHRKGLCIDGAVGHVGGLCVGDAWAGDAGRGIPPWRDTAVRIEGPGAAVLGQAFNETWSLCGEPLSPELLAASAQGAAPAGDMAVRVVSGLPGRSRIYRAAQIVLPAALSRVWITDAYFLTPPSLYEALLASARDGVDVRVLVPGRSDVPWVSWVGRAGYAGLLAAGVRIYEWEGPMLHAKTSVVDGRFCRVGSSNLNLSSLLTNWELDVLVEDRDFGAMLEEMFLADLKNTSELVLRPRRARLPGRVQRKEGRRWKPWFLRSQKEHGEKGRAGAVVSRAGAAVLGVALRRRFEQRAWSVSSVGAALLLLFGGVGLWRPAALGLPLALLLLWLGIGSLGHAYAQWRDRDRGLPGPRRRKRALAAAGKGEGGVAVLAAAEPHRAVEGVVVRDPLVAVADHNTVAVGDGDGAVGVGAGAADPGVDRGPHA